MLLKKNIVGFVSVLVTCGLLGVALAGVPADKKDKSAKQNDALSGMAHRASEIQGMTVNNDAGKTLGTVSDFVINVRTGDVKYAALSYGGLFGFGDKLFAVPWKAFGHRHDSTGDTDVLTLDISPDVLKNAPGFDQNNWPDFADAALIEKLEKHYGTDQKDSKKQDRDQTTSAGPNQDIQLQAGPVEVDIKVSKPTEAKKAETPKSSAKLAKQEALTHRSDSIIGMEVRNMKGKAIGSINDLLVDMDTGHVRYAAVSYGGILGFGDKLFAVPWNAFNCEYSQEDNSYYLTTDIDEATLSKATGFDQENWPERADATFGEVPKKETPSSDSNES